LGSNYPFARLPEAIQRGALIPVRTTVFTWKTLEQVVAELAIYQQCKNGADSTCKKVCGDVSNGVHFFFV
jgi:hypothetical protein